MIVLKIQELKNFSVIIPNLNSPTIDKTIISLENQAINQKWFEVIIVGMDTHNLIIENELIKFIRSRNPMSPAKARNVGAKQANGEILVFLDADCQPDSNWLRILTERFSSPNTTIVGGGVYFAMNNYWNTVDNVTFFHEYLYFKKSGQRELLPSLNLAIRKSVFDIIGGFDERYPSPSGEDADLTIRLRNAGHTLEFEPKAIVLHDSDRSRFKELLLHSYIEGKYSTKVDPRYNHEAGIPLWLRNRIGILIIAPILSVLVTTRIMVTPKIFKKYWYTIPFIYLSKLAWCFGAANHFSQYNHETT